MSFSRIAENLVAALRGLPANPSRSRLKSEISIREALESILKKHPIHASIEVILAENWKYLLGPALSARSIPEGLSGNGNLIIRVSSAAIRTELQFQEKELIKKINSLKGCESIQGLIFRL